MKKPFFTMFASIALLLSSPILTAGTDLLVDATASEENKKEELEEKAGPKAASEDVKDERLQKAQRAAQQKAREIEGLREAKADVIEYTLDPSSVELVVEMDPGNYGFRTRNHRMTLAGDFDLFFRGRGMLRYDYRFFNYLSVGLLGGVDWSDISLANRFRIKKDESSPWQLSALGGVALRWRLTEWYMHSTIFLEPSLLFGRLWQKIGDFGRSGHWRLMPGIFVGNETVFDSGLSLAVRLGAEFPLDFPKNTINEIVMPLLVVGLGFSI